MRDQRGDRDRARRCGEGGSPEKGLEATGPGVRASQPPWAPEYGGLDAPGIVHMEAPRPFRYTLGDFFDIWGSGSGRGRSAVSRTAGPTGCGSINGKPISDPARHVPANGDNISIGYGTRNPFPHQPGTRILKEVEAGKGRFSCSGGPVKKQKFCTTTSSSAKK